MAAEALVRVDGAVVRHPGRAPIGPIELEASPGEIIALVGASGCGKSTTLRLLAGLERPHEGQVHSRVPRGGTGLVFQAPTLMPWASARDNVALPLVLSGADRRDARERAGRALARVGLAERGDARPAQLSGGMAMRVALARALIGDPVLLLLDEPFGALDSVTRRILIEDLHAAWAERGFAAVFVTHDVGEAAYVARRVMVMDGAGRIHEATRDSGPVPRPQGWRADPGHLERVETIARALAHSMGAAA